MCGGRQVTIRRAASAAGRGLHSGRPCEVTVKPAPPGTGIRFVRVDLNGAPEVCATPEAVRVAPRSTALAGAGGTCVRTVEHLLAACAGLGVDNLSVELDSEELPCLDGSALSYCRLLLESGLAEQTADVAWFPVTRSVWIREGRALVAALPPVEGTCGPALEAVYTFLGRPEGPCGFAAYPWLDFVRDIAPARTPAFADEVHDLRSRGMGLGADPASVVLIGSDGTVADPILDEEPARHKLLDLLGDLKVLGRVSGLVIAVGSGHRHNHALVRSLHGRGIPSEG